MPDHVGWLASDWLLKQTQAAFPDMKSSVLSRIMKFTFPECRKVINKYGYFYAGLLPQPTVSTRAPNHYLSLNLTSRLCGQLWAGINLSFNLQIGTVAQLWVGEAVLQFWVGIIMLIFTCTRTESRLKRPR